jgi:hypothetical protein
LLFAFGFWFGGLFGLGFLELWLDSFALGFLVWEAFGWEKNYWTEKNCREIAEKKRMAKEGLIESLHQEF